MIKTMKKLDNILILNALHGKDESLEHYNDLYRLDVSDLKKSDEASYRLGIDNGMTHKALVLRNVVSTIYKVNVPKFIKNKESYLLGFLEGYQK